jgi:hypothetical protein
MSSVSGQFEKYDHSSVGKMEIEIPRPVQESCFLLRDVSQDPEFFTKYSITDPGEHTSAYIELDSWLQVLRELELVGNTEHQVTKLVAQKIFARVAGRWAKNMTADLFVRCLRLVQEYLIFQTLRTMEGQIRASAPSSARVSVTFR